MRFKVLDGFCLGPIHGDVYPGDVVDLAEREAAQYVVQGRLAPAEEVEVQAGVEVHAGSPEFPQGGPAAAQTQDPGPRRRGRRGKEE